MDNFDKTQNVLWDPAQELANIILDIDPEKYPDEFENMIEQIWLEMCSEEGINPYE